MKGSEQNSLVAKVATTAFGTMHYQGPNARTSKEVILFLHGFGSNGSVWNPVIRSAARKGLSDGRDFIMIDLPGMGLSENKLGHLDMKIVGAELIGLMYELGYSRIRVAGHSMGGFLALDMAAEFPSEISSVHIVSGSYFTLLDMVNHPLATLIKSPGVAIFYRLQLHIFKYAFISDFINRLSVKVARARGRSPRYSLGGPSFKYGADNGYGYDAQRIWGGIVVPVFGAFGAKDRLVTPRDMAQLQKILPKSKLTLILGTGHSSLVDRPDAVVDALFSSLPKSISTKV